MDVCDCCKRVLTVELCPNGYIDAKNGKFCSTDCLVEHEFNEEMERLCST